MLLAASGCQYVMGLPQADDIMLMYQSTGVHDVAAAREILGKEPIREFR
jgi:ethanolamine ammonia-lyase large subunit